MDIHDADLSGLANASGYLFQLKIENTVKTSRLQPHWTVDAHEHPWSHPETGEEGFIDLILTPVRGRNIKMVVECKRVKDGTWLFLLPDEKAGLTSFFTCPWVYKGSDRRDIAGWDKFEVHPATLQSEFCCIRGSGEKEPPFLERLSRKLLRAIESVVNEECRPDSEPAASMAIVFVPIIVTTARLAICRFDPNSVSVTKGILPDEGASFEVVPFLRFTKSLEARPGDMSRAGQQSVFVITGSELETFLANFELDCLGEPPTPPWRLHGTA